MTDKWTQTVCSLFQLASFTLHNACGIHSSCYMCQQFILFIAKYYSTVWLYHNVFVHPSVEGNVSYFHYLVITEKATLNIHKQVFAQM